MKRHFSLFALLILSSSLIFSSCKKEVVGPQGPKGDTGNANIRVINFGTRTFFGSQNYTIPNVSKEEMDKSILLVYYNPSNESETSWYPAPGLGSTGSYDVRYAVYKVESNSPDYSLLVRLHDPNTGGNYNNEVTFSKLKVVLAPATSINNVDMPTVDLNDYQSVKEFYNIEE